MLHSGAAIFCSGCFFQSGLWYSVHVMDPEKRLGIVLIIIGLLIPLAALPFVSGFSKDKGFLGNFYQVGIDIRKDTNDNVPSQPTTNIKETNSKVRIAWSMFIPHKIPFRFFFAPMVLFIYIGIIRIERSRKKNRTSDQRPVP